MKLKGFSQLLKSRRVVKRFAIQCVCFRSFLVAQFSSSTLNFIFASLRFSLSLISCRRSLSEKNASESCEKPDRKVFGTVAVG
jgi:hypothetical protein